MNDPQPKRKYRAATVVRQLEYDPCNDTESGRVFIAEGDHEDGYSYTVLDDEKEGFRDIECEALAVHRAREPMSKEAIQDFAVEQERAGRGWMDAE